MYQISHIYFKYAKIDCLMDGSFKNFQNSSQNIVYDAGWGQNRLQVNDHPHFPQLSYQCHWQLVLEKGCREKGMNLKQTNK